MIQRNLLVAMMAPLSLILAILLIWSANKGFDFTDESYYILMLTQPENSGNVFYYHYVIDFLFGWLNPGLVGYRLVRLFLIIMVSVYLGRVLNLWSKKIGDNDSGLISGNWAWFLITFVGLSLSYSIYPQCLSYNSLSVILLALILGRLLSFSIHFESDGSGMHCFNSFILGLLCLMLFFTKFSAGILATMVSLIWIGGHMWIWNSRKSWLRCALYFFGAVVLGMMFCSLTMKPIYLWIDDFVSSVEHMESHQGSDLLSRYFDSIWLMIREFFNHYIFFPLLIGVWYWFKPQISKLNSGSIIHVSVGVLLICSATAHMYVNDLFQSGIRLMHNAIFFFITTGFLAFAFLIRNLRRNKGSLVVKRKRFALFVLLILMLPFVGSIGTNNMLNVQILQYSFAFTLVISLILNQVYQRVDRISAFLLFIILVVGSVSQIYSGMVRFPYRISTPLTLQNKNVNLPNGDRLLVDQKTAAHISVFINQINQSNYKQGDPMLVLEGMPGYIYLADAVVTGNSWNKNSLPGALCNNLSRSELSNLNETVVITAPNNVIQQQSIDCMKHLGINFPEGYANSGVINNPVFNQDLAVLVPVRKD